MPAPRDEAKSLQRRLLLDRHRQRRACEFDLHMIPHDPADDLSADGVHGGRVISTPLCFRTRPDGLVQTDPQAIEPAIVNGISGNSSK
jgi:hypothetical protein